MSPDVRFNAITFFSFVEVTKKINKNKTQKIYFSHPEIRLFILLVSLMNGPESIRTQVNSYSNQFVLILVNSYSFMADEPCF